MTFKDLMDKIGTYQAAFEAFEKGTPTITDARTVMTAYIGVKEYLDDTTSVAGSMVNADDALSRYLAKNNVAPPPVSQ